MKGRRYTPQQIVRKLRGAERLQAEGANIATVARNLEISEQNPPPLAEPVREHEGRRARSRRTCVVRSRRNDRYASPPDGPPASMST
jgi:DNA-binding transcriptional MerR regulator